VNGALIPSPQADAVGLAPTVPTLAGVPAGPLFALADLVTGSPAQLAGVQITPDPDGGATLTAAAPAAIAQLQIPDAEAARPVCLPGRVLQRLRSRHGKAAEWVSVAACGDDSPLLRVVSLSAGAACAVTCPEAPALPAVPLPSLEAEPGPDRPALLLDPALLSRGLRLIEALGAGPAELRWISGHPVIGLALLPPPEVSCRGAVWLCRCAADG
jgi:hypothetical protein